MSTITGVHRSNAPGWGGRVLVVLVVLMVVYAVAAGLAFAPVKPGQHAVLKHNSDALAVRDCLQQNGALGVWQKADGRIIRLCEVEDGVFGLQVLEPDERGTLHEITAYIKNKMTRIEQVIRYLEQNCGAVKIWP